MVGGGCGWRRGRLSQPSFLPSPSNVQLDCGGREGQAGGCGMRGCTSCAGWCPGQGWLGLEESSACAWLGRTEKTNHMGPAASWVLRSKACLFFPHYWRLYYQMFLGKWPPNCATQRIKRGRGKKQAFSIWLIAL